MLILWLEKSFQLVPEESYPSKPVPRSTRTQVLLERVDLGVRDILPNPLTSPKLKMNQMLYTTQTNLRNMISTIFGMWTLSGPAVRGHA